MASSVPPGSTRAAKVSTEALDSGAGKRHMILAVSRNAGARKAAHAENDDDDDDNNDCV